MRNMSFMLTTPQMYARTKDVTRRIGWWHLKPGDIVMAVEKGMGLKKGEKVKRIYPIRILSVRVESIGRMTNPYYDPEYGKEEVIREGFPEMSPREFVEMFCKSHRCKDNDPVNRIEFKEVKESHATP